MCYQFSSKFRNVKHSNFNTFAIMRVNYLEFNKSVECIGITLQTSCYHLDKLLHCLFSAHRLLLSAVVVPNKKVNTLSLTAHDQRVVLEKIDAYFSRV